MTVLGVSLLVVAIGAFMVGVVWERVLPAILTFIGGGILSWVLAALIAGIDYSDGERVGVVVKLSRQGWLWPSWEGEMALGGGDGSTFSAQTYAFSVERGSASEEPIRAALDDAMRTGQKVRVRYHQTAQPWPTRGATEYYVTAVEPFGAAEAGAR